MTRKPKPPKITPELADAVKTYLLAKAYRQTIEPVVTEYQTAILAKHAFPVADRWRDHYAEMATVVTDPKRAYLLSDDDADVIYAEWDAAAKAAGFDLMPGYCPLLVAQNAEMQAENAVIRAAEYIAGLELDKVNSILYKHRREIIDNTVGLVLALTGMTAADVLKVR